MNLQTVRQLICLNAVTYDCVNKRRITITQPSIRAITTIEPTISFLARSG